MLEVEFEHSSASVRNDTVNQHFLWAEKYDKVAAWVIQEYQSSWVWFSTVANVAPNCETP